MGYITYLTYNLRIDIKLTEKLRESQEKCGNLNDKLSKKLYSFLCDKNIPPKLGILDNSNLNAFIKINWQNQQVARSHAERAPLHHLRRQIGVVVGPADDAQIHLDCFSLFLPNNLLQAIVDRTKNKI